VEGSLFSSSRTSLSSPIVLPSLPSVFFREFFSSGLARLPSLPFLSRACLTLCPPFFFKPLQATLSLPSSQEVDLCFAVRFLVQSSPPPLKFFFSFFLVSIVSLPPSDLICLPADRLGELKDFGADFPFPVGSLVRRISSVFPLDPSEQASPLRIVPQPTASPLRARFPIFSRGTRPFLSSVHLCAFRLPACPRLFLVPLTLAPNAPAPPWTPT